MTSLPPDLRFPDSNNAHDDFYLEYVKDPDEAEDVVFGMKMLFDGYLRGRSITANNGQVFTLTTVEEIMEPAFGGNTSTKVSRYTQCQQRLSHLAKQLDHIWADSNIRKFLHPATPYVKVAGETVLPHYVEGEAFGIAQKDALALITQNAPKGTLFEFIVTGDPEIPTLAGLITYSFYLEDMGNPMRTIQVRRGITLGPNFHGLGIGSLAAQLGKTAFQQLANATQFDIVESSWVEIGNKASNKLCSAYYESSPIRTESVEDEFGNKEFNIYEMTHIPKV